MTVLLDQWKSKVRLNRDMGAKTLVWSAICGHGNFVLESTRLEVLHDTHYLEAHSQRRQWLVSVQVRIVLDAVVL